MPINRGLALLFAISFLAEQASAFGGDSDCTLEILAWNDIFYNGNRTFKEIIPTSNVSMHNAFR